MQMTSHLAYLIEMDVIINKSRKLAKMCDSFIIGSPLNKKLLL